MVKKRTFKINQIDGRFFLFVVAETSINSQQFGTGPFMECFVEKTVIERLNHG